MVAERLIGTIFGKRPAHELDAAVQAFTALKRFSGAVLVAHRGKILLSNGYGLANIEHRIANTPQTVFRLGSTTKPFTATVIMQLEEGGQLSVNDPLHRYFPDYPNGDRITLHHLLSNTSGIPDYLLLPGFRETMGIEATAAELIARFKDLPLQFEPGAEFGYSNSNWVLLGAIIEQLTGQSYADAVHARIFRPLGMARSGYEWFAPVIANRADGYADHGEALTNADAIASSVMHGAGGLHSTVEDLYAFDRALYGETLLRQATLRRMFQPLSEMNGVGYGYGWEIRTQSGRRAVGHAGGLDGFIAEFVRYVDDDATIIFLSNLSGTAQAEISETLAAILFGEPYVMPSERRFVQVDPAVFTDYLGEYELTFAGRTHTLIFRVEEKRLVMDIAGWSSSVLFPMSETTFYGRSKGDVEMTFLRTGHGGVEQIDMIWGGYRLTANRKH